MKLLSAVLCLTIIACVAADYGYYVPKAFYRIDENGQRSQTYFIEVPEGAVHPRFRRSAQVQPTFGLGFQPFPQFNFPAIHPGQGVQISGISSSVNSGPDLNSRFGEDDSSGVVTQGQTTTFHSNNGQTVETTHRFGPDGKVQTSVNKHGTEGGPDLNSRFGEDNGPQPQTHGQTTTYHSNNGKYTETVNRFGPDGKVETTVNKGKL